MENMTPLDICIVVFGAILAVATVVNTLGSAAEKVVKAVKAAKAPGTAQDSRLDELEKWRAEVDGRLLRGNTHFELIDAGNRITQRALLALLNHGLDGNNIQQMKDSQKEITNYLINR